MFKETALRTKILILYNVGSSWSLLITNRTVIPLRTPFGLLIPLLQSSITRNYNHTQLFLPLCNIYTAYNHLYCCNYNHYYFFTLIHARLLNSLQLFFTWEPPVSVSCRELWTVQSESEPESLYDWQSVSLSVLVSSPVWSSWPDI
jgi:hypothetical protein